MIIEATHSANTGVPTDDTDRSREQDDHAIRQAALAFARAHVKSRGPPISLDSTKPSPPTPAAFWFRPLVHPDAKQPLPLTTFSVGPKRRPPPPPPQPREESPEPESTPPGPASTSEMAATRTSAGDFRYDPCRDLSAASSDHAYKKRAQNHPQGPRPIRPETGTDLTALGALCYHAHTSTWQRAQIWCKLLRSWKSDKHLSWRTWTDTVEPYSKICILTRWRKQGERHTQDIHKTSWRPKHGSDKTSITQQKWCAPGESRVHRLELEHLESDDCLHSRHMPELLLKVSGPCPRAGRRGGMKRCNAPSIGTLEPSRRNGNGQSAGQPLSWSNQATTRDALWQECLMNEHDGTARCHQDGRDGGRKERPCSRSIISTQATHTVVIPRRSTRMTRRDRRQSAPGHPPSPLGTRMAETVWPVSKWTLRRLWLSVIVEVGFVATSTAMHSGQ